MAIGIPPGRVSLVDPWDIVGDRLWWIPRNLWDSLSADPWDIPGVVPLVDAWHIPVLYSEYLGLGLGCPCQVLGGVGQYPWDIFGVLGYLGWISGVSRSSMLGVALSILGVSIHGVGMTLRCPRGVERYT